MGLTNALGYTWVLTRNSLGQVTKVTDPLGHATKYTYEGPDWATVTDPLGRTHTQFTDAAGRVLRQTFAGGRRVQARYDALNRITQQMDPQGQLVQFSFDANGHLKSHTDQKNQTTTYVYNTLGKVMSKTDPLLQTETTLYEPGGKVMRHTDRKGQVMGVTYDPLGRPKQIGFGATAAAPTAYTSTVSLAWDKANRVTKLIDSVSGTITRRYNLNDQVVEEVSPQGQVNYTYNKIGQRLSMTVLGQPQVTYRYDAAGQLIQITQAAGASNNQQVQEIKFVYDEAGRKTQMTLANGIVVKYGYDNAGQLIQITHVRTDGSTFGSMAYTYDANGQRTRATGTLASLELPQAVTDTQFDANNRLIRYNGSVYTYDANGNLMSDGRNTYAWDERNQLKSMTGGAVASFVYDSMGRRVAKTVAGTTTGYLYDGPNFVQELMGMGSASAVKANLITAGVDQTLLRSETGTTATLSHFLADANNNVLALTDASQAIATRYRYGVYGQTTSTGAVSSNSQQYTGRENDGTGLMYYRARYYHLGCARFISEDPIGWASGQVNNYAYVGGDPVNFVDPDGQIGVAGAIIGGLAGAAIGAAGAAATCGNVWRAAVFGALNGAIMGALGLPTGWGAVVGAGLGATFDIAEQGQSIGDPGFQGFNVGEIIGAAAGGAAGGILGGLTGSNWGSGAVAVAGRFLTESVFSGQSEVVKTIGTNIGAGGNSCAK